MSSNTRVGIALYFVVHSLPEAGKKEILVNFDIDTSIFIQNSVSQVGKVDLIFSRLDSDSNTYITKTIDKKKHYILAIGISGR